VDSKFKFYNAGRIIPARSTGLSELEISRQGVRPSAAAAQGALTSLGGKACELEARQAKPSRPDAL
jgi:hypothetical protein